MTIEALLENVEADCKSGPAQATSAVAEIKALVANRVGDVLIALIVIGSIWFGHSL